VRIVANVRMRSRERGGRCVDRMGTVDGSKAARSCGAVVGPRVRARSPASWRRQSRAAFKAAGPPQEIVDIPLGASSSASPASKSRPGSEAHKVRRDGTDERIGAAELDGDLVANGLQGSASEFL